MEPLIEALKDDSKKVRCSATEALGTTGDNRAVEPLIQRLKDSDQFVRSDARDSLKKITKQDFGEDYEKWKEWYRSIPKDVRPEKDQPFYHLLAENADTEYIAYVSEQNLVPDASDEPLRHPQVGELFEDLKNGIFRFRFLQEH